MRSLFTLFITLIITIYFYLQLKAEHSSAVHLHAIRVISSWLDSPYLLGHAESFDTGYIIVLGEEETNTSQQPLL